MASIDPLSPLAATEVEAAAAIIAKSEYSSPTIKFVTIALREPVKPGSLVFDAEALPAREAFVVAFDTAAQLINEAVVDLDAESVISWTPVPERFPAYLGEHFTLIEDGVKADPRWQEAMRARGVEDFDLCMVDPWPAVRARFPRAVEPVTVRSRRGHAAAEYRPARAEIAIPDSREGRWALRELVVLHEIAHHLDDGPGPAHGRGFVLVLTELVGTVLGPEAGFVYRVIMADAGVV